MTDVWTMQSREDELEFVKQHGIDLPFDAKHSYSRDRNLWHISHEGLELEDPANEPNYKDLLVLGVSPEDAPDQPEYVTMTFEAGVPKTLNGKAMKVSEIITELNALGGKHGIGIIDIVENRVVGMKSRGVYETPGGTILMEAHDQLEELILDLIDNYVEVEYEEDDEEGTITFYGNPKSYAAIQKHLEECGFEDVGGDFTYIPNDMKEVTPEQRETLDKMIERLEEFDVVQTVYTNMQPEEGE